MRRALNYAFDFETLKQTIFYGQYERIDSFFYGTDLAASGLPEGQELDILESVKDKVPPEVFTTPYANPVGGDPQKERENLRPALTLLQEAGYQIDGSKLVNAKTGEQLTFELLLERRADRAGRARLPGRTLRKIGIDMRVRPVDHAAMDQPRALARLRHDLHRLAAIAFAGQRAARLSGARRPPTARARATTPASRTRPSTRLIERIVLAKDRDELVAATHALDRVLMANQYVIPSYALRFARIARWDRFAHPAELPEYSVGFPTVWWWDEAKAQKISAGGAQ